MNQFTTIKHLGEGGFGKVDLCKNSIDNQLYAIKYINTENGYDCTEIFNIFQEANNLKILKHKNVVRIDNFLCLSNRQFILVTEYCEGGELNQYINQKKRISEKECHTLFKQMIQAIKYIHRFDIIHRDIKPQNILFGDENRTEIKLVDFGLAGICSTNL